AFEQEKFNKYGYNDRSELVESSRYVGPDLADMSNPITSEYRSYKYDNIGNRENAIDWDDINKDLQSTYYESNSLNQYVQTDDGKEQNSFLYDADGNLTSVISSDGDVMMYTYNCENRLIAAGPANPDEGDLKGEYLYDYMGRRVQKKVFKYIGLEWKLNETRLFVWDGWNMIEEVVRVVSEVEYSKYYVWGLDLSQSLDGAGGVGGLLAWADDDELCYYTFDGNGNVGQTLDSVNASLTAHYVYDPFGNAILISDIYSKKNLFRFSTKYFDIETNLSYYGYRYYLSMFGRWIKRDPIGENGDLNLFSFIINNPLNAIDPKGEKTTFTIKNIGFGAFVSVSIGIAIAETDCFKNKYYKADYFLFSIGLSAGLNLFGKNEYIFKAIDSTLKNHYSVLLGSTFTIEKNFPPEYVSFLDIEGKSVSFLYKFVFGSIKIGTYEGGRSDIDVISHGISASIGVQLFKIEGVHLLRTNKPKEYCCDK
ncbi:YD repeat-containing protein, partial [Candidatus Magnetomorum sp. HK-1]